MSDETYSLTVSGLLRKRAELQAENASIRERMATLAQDVEAIDRILDALGYAGDLPNRTARQERLVLFYRNELSAFILSALREAGKPMTTRDIALKLCEVEGRQGFDRRLLADVVRRCGRALRQMRAARTVTVAFEGRTSFWRAVDA